MKHTTDISKFRNELKCLARERMQDCLCSKYPDWNRVAIDEPDHLTPKAKRLLDLVDKLCCKQAELFARIDEANMFELQRIKREIEDE
ncbi:hypothetical protein EG832_22040 [bacterium]|nr:hypothetical protein [bacterium]